MAPTRVIKRYANRKLYDTERSCYITLDDIALMIKAGEEIRVVDNKSHEDLTGATLAQIIFEEEKKSSFMPMALLRDLIQNGGDAVSDFYRGQVETVQAAANDFKTKAQDIRSRAQTFRTEWEGKLGSVIRKGDKPHDGEPVPEEQLVTDGKDKPKLLKELAELLQNSQNAFEELQSSFEERVKSGVGNVSRYTHLGRDMEDIRKRLEALEQRLENVQ